MIKITFYINDGENDGENIDINAKSMEIILKKQSAKLLVYSFAHFWIDFACACLIFSAINTKDWLFCLLIYNFCAFALQMPFGLLADRLDQNAGFAAFGCILTAGAFVCGAMPVLACITAGVGNAMFHIGGGLDVLNDSFGKNSLDENKKTGKNTPRSGPLGVFVSPGALGLFFGRMMGRQNQVSLWIPAVILCITAIAIFIFYSKQKETFTGNNIFSPRIQSHYIIPAICLFLVVCIRSYTGMSLNFDWKSDGWWGIGLVIAVALGKIAGGFISDRIGASRTALLTLGLSAVFFLFSSIPALGILAVFFFNMTMPVTLCAMAELFPGAKGFSFGLLTFALFLGFIPVYLGAESIFIAVWIFSICCGISLILLWAGLKGGKK